MSTLRIAQQKIDPCKDMDVVMVEEAEVSDIIDVILYADQQSVASTDRFAPFLRGSTDMATLENIYRFVRSNIKYKRDKPRKEVVRTPGCTIKVKHGDCKSMTVLTGALLRSLGYDFSYKVAFYDPAEPGQGHIYSVVSLGRKKVIVDPVHYRFNEEVPYWKAKTYPVSKETGIGGIGQGYRFSSLFTIENLIIAAAGYWLVKSIRA